MEEKETYSIEKLSAAASGPASQSSNSLEYLANSFRSSSTACGGDLSTRSSRIKSSEIPQTSAYGINGHNSFGILSQLSFNTGRLPATRPYLARKSRAEETSNLPSLDFIPGSQSKIGGGCVSITLSQPRRYESQPMRQFPPDPGRGRPRTRREVCRGKDPSHRTIPARRGARLPRVEKIPCRVKAQKWDHGKAVA